MSEQAPRRRLAAILAADVVGYGRLMEQDEAGTLAALKKRRREVLDPLIAKYGGRVFKLVGDGVLVEFASAVHAVQCAIELHEGMTAANRELPADRRIILRIGINLGDVMVEGSDLYGDGVNIAARLEGIAEPGGLLISGSAYDQVKNKIDTGFEDLGSRSLKNITEKIRIYQPRLGRQIEAGPALALPDKPSIAVLPFTNLSADPEQAFFADGLTEDLITDLSKVPSLFVIARNSSFVYKGHAINIQRVARELGVKYVLEGSGRRAGDRVRINAQLIEAATGGHIWAERFDCDLVDIFAVQDEVIGKIVGALVGKLIAAGTRERYRPASLEAYDLCVRGRAHFLHSSGETIADAIPLFERAVALDPNYAEAYRWLAYGQSIAWLHMNRPVVPFRALSIEHANKAALLDPEDSGTHWVRAFVLLYERRWDESSKEFETALRLNPNDADAWSNLADLRVMEGRGTEAVKCVENAFRLNPAGTAYYWDLGQAQYAAGQYESAVKTLRNEATYRTGSRRFLAAALAQLGRLDEAREEAKLYMSHAPHFRIGYWVETQPFRDLAMRDRFVDGYRKAGLPE